MKTTYSLLSTLLVVALFAVASTGCNTVKGAGRDLQKGGKAVERAADDAQTNDNDKVVRHTISASAGIGGSISPKGVTTVSQKSDLTVMVEADRGYHVADVLVDNRSVGAVSRYTFENIAASHVITAKFTRDPLR